MINNMLSKMSGGILVFFPTIDSIQVHCARDDIRTNMKRRIWVVALANSLRMIVNEGIAHEEERLI